MKAAVYLRISEDRSGEQLGVARQRQDCEQLCRSKGWSPVEYIDNDTSATSGKRRPAYEQMLGDIRDGVIGAVVAWDLDRLHRRPVELEAFMALADEKHLALATVSGDVDLSTAQGRLVARLKGSVAAHEGEHRKARQLRATRQLAEAGVPNWSKAFGFDDDRQPDPKTAPLVKQAYADVLAGVSLSAICRQWNTAGVTTTTGKTWVASALSKFLRKPRNAGMRTYRNTLYGPVDRDSVVGKGSWPPLVDESTFWAVQSVLDAPGRAKHKAVRRHLLTGLARCGKCGNTLSGHHTSDKRIVYVCKTCHGVSILAANIEPIVYNIAAGRLAKPDAVDLLRKELHDHAEAEALRVEANSLRARLDSLAVEFADGELTASQLRVATARMQEKLTAVEHRQHDQERLRVFDGIPLGTPEVADAVTRLAPDRFRAIIDVLMTVTVAPVGKSGKVFNPERVQVNWR